MFAYGVSYDNLPSVMAEFLLGITSNGTIMLFIIVLFLLICGMFMETTVITLILTPICCLSSSRWGLTRTFRHCDDDHRDLRCYDAADWYCAVYDKFRDGMQSGRNREIFPAIFRDDLSGAFYLYSFPGFGVVASQFGIWQLKNCSEEYYYGEL